MGALAVPKRMALTATNGRLCARLGVKLDGRDMGNSVHEYDVEKGFVRLGNGEIRHGKVEAYWR